MKPTTSKRKYILPEKIYLKPTSKGKYSKRKYTWNQLPARENIHETNYQRKYTWNQLYTARENIH